MSSESPLRGLWGRLDPQLQDALALAYAQARREGKGRISTRLFFAAVARLRPGALAALLDLLPEGALPGPTAADAPGEGRPTEGALLSPCVEGALLRLSRDAAPGHKLSAAEVFVEVAKRGTGASVARLRERGVTAEEIDRLARQAGPDAAPKPPA
jgi:hypothetical protein